MIVCTNLDVGLFGDADNQPDIILYFTELIDVGFLNSLLISS